MTVATSATVMNDISAIGLLSAAMDRIRPVVKAPPAEEETPRESV